MSDISDKLRQLRALGGLMTGAELRRDREQFERQRETGEFEIERCVPGEFVGEPDSRFYLVRKTYPLETDHGNVVLGDTLEALPEHIALAACDSTLERFDPATAVFIDVETTGLAGGTGTVAFLVGVGYFEQEAFRIEQTFMRDFDDEEPMLAWLAPLLRRGEYVVTFNGKTFDIPLLRTRFIANRLPFPLDALPHFDLIHATRRIWKLRLGDCSLGNVEREVLGIRRHGDVPSAEIPEIWFDYLRTRDARRLKAVFYHHEMDVLSLAALTARMTRALDAPPGEGLTHAEDRLSLARLHFRQRRYEAVAEHAERLLDAETDRNIRYHTFEQLGFAYKRLRRWNRMQDAFERMAREFPKDLLSRFELAKHHEHRTRDLPEALRVCEEALAYVETRQAACGPQDAVVLYKDGLLRRHDRIRRKLARQGSRGEAGDESLDDTESDRGKWDEWAE